MLQLFDNKAITQKYIISASESNPTAAKASDAMFGFGK
jgi:hypothetical protein